MIIVLNWIRSYYAFLFVQTEDRILAVIVFIAFSFANCFSSSYAIPNKEIDLLGVFFGVKSVSDSIQKAIDALPENGGTIFIKANTYILDKRIRPKRFNVKILGEKDVE